MTPEELDAINLTSVKAFVLRARRIQQHSVARDPALLAEYQLPRFKVQINPATGEAKVTNTLPNEEQFESAAARVRPLILSGEPTHHEKFMKALLYFANKASLPAQAIESLRDWKKQWAAINPNNAKLRFYDVRQQEGESEEQRITDVRLAYAWIYGDVVHADADRRAESQRFGIEERFRAAVPIIVRLILMSLFTLRVIEDMVKRGALPDLSDVFEEEVVVTRTTMERQGRIYVRDHNSDGSVPEPPPIGQPLGDEWKPFEQFLPDVMTSDEPEDESEEQRDE